MTLTTSTFLQNVILFIRDNLRNNITDPISGRASNLWVMTSYPKRTPIQYPLITVKNNNITSNKLGMASEMSRVELDVEVRIWARNIKEKDDLTQKIINQLRTNQLGTGSTSEYQIFGFDMTSAVNVDEEDVKSKVLVFKYQAILG